MNFYLFFRFLSSFSMLATMPTITCFVMSEVRQQTQCVLQYIVSPKLSAHWRRRWSGGQRMCQKFRASFLRLQAFRRWQAVLTVATFKLFLPKKMSRHMLIDIKPTAWTFLQWQGLTSQYILQMQMPLAGAMTAGSSRAVPSGSVWRLTEIYHLKVLASWEILDTQTVSGYWLPFLEILEESKVCTTSHTGRPETLVKVIAIFKV